MAADRKQIVRDAYGFSILHCLRSA